MNVEDLFSFDLEYNLKMFRFSGLALVGPGWPLMLLNYNSSPETPVYVKHIVSFVLIFAWGFILRVIFQVHVYYTLYSLVLVLLLQLLKTCVGILSDSTYDVIIAWVPLLYQTAAPILDQLYPNLNPFSKLDYLIDMSYPDIPIEATEPEDHKPVDFIESEDVLNSYISIPFTGVSVSLSLCRILLPLLFCITQILMTLPELVPQLFIH
jgi:hypothetical protein